MMNAINYYDYIASPEWKEKADAAKGRAGYRCQVCNNVATTASPLNAHHRSYKRLGHEEPEDIIVLCRGCHKLFHQSMQLHKEGLPPELDFAEALHRWGIPHVSEMPDDKDGWDYYEDAKVLIRTGAKWHGNGDEPDWQYYDQCIRYLKGYLGI